MPSTGFGRAYSLTATNIDAAVQRKSPGAYALGTLRSDGVFVVGKVGRSDTDVGHRLLSQVGDYTHFKFGYCSSPKAAFLKECDLYHDFAPPGNKIHPDRPNNSGWKCPGCPIFG